MYPARPEHTGLQDTWTYELFLKYAELAAKDGLAFALGFGGSGNTDGIDQWGAMFHAFGADLIDREGTIKVGSPEMQACLEYAAKLVKFLPDEGGSYDDASNNRALIGGKTALVFNAPSAWYIAKRDAPAIAQDCWTFPAPVGPHGRFVPTETFFWGVWNFSPNQSAAKDLLAHLMQKDLVEERIVAVEGYNLPPFAGMRDFPVWETVGPPAGTLFNYPIKSWHGSQPSLPGSEASPDIASQIYSNAIHTGMIARLKTGSSIKEVVSWSRDQLETLTR
jgi:ABC-type glycerol-3-phosphate transport system substrate-binding protein